MRIQITNDKTGMILQMWCSGVIGDGCEHWALLGLAQFSSQTCSVLSPGRKWGDGRGEEETAKGWFTPHLRNPEQYPDCRTVLIGGGNTDVCPGRQTANALAPPLHFCDCQGPVLESCMGTDICTHLRLSPQLSSASSPLPPHKFQYCPRHHPVPAATIPVPIHPRRQLYPSPSTSPCLSTTEN